MLIYDKSGRELLHRILLSFFVVKILTIKESVARLDLQMVISHRWPSDYTYILILKGIVSSDQ